ncbi:MAG: ABC transporter permease subunit [Chlorobia bacterium]|nr:ABC transporter permease subunit [Fimbriimonadaceae bacterium]
MAFSPIADLSYRNYDGELTDTRFRWWVIAKATIMMAMKKKAMWIYALLSGGYYFGMIFTLFVIDQMSVNTPPGTPNPLKTFLGRLVWKDQFLVGFSYGQIWMLAIGLILGAGAIANDNRANALLVYLSKPCDKKDYLFGKWFGVFLPLLVVSAVPPLFFYFYGAMSYRENGFLSSDPLLIFRVIVMLIVGAAFNSSLIIGFSSMFNQGRMAGAVYAGFYFISNFFTQLMTLAWLGVSGGRRGHSDAPEGVVDLVGKLYYGSVDGLNIGMAKGVLGTDGSPPFGIPSPFKMVPAPSLFFSLGLIVIFSCLMMFIAWRRIRPVEIVG